MIDAESILADPALRFGVVLPSMAESMSILETGDMIAVRHLLDLAWRESAARAAAYHFRQTGAVVDEYQISGISKTLHDAFIDGYVAELYTRAEIENLIAAGPFAGNDRTRPLQRHGLFILPDRSGMSLIRLCQVQEDRLATLERGDDPEQMVQYGLRLARSLQAAAPAPAADGALPETVLKAVFQPCPEPVVRLGPSWNALLPQMGSDWHLAENPDQAIAETAPAYASRPASTSAPAATRMPGSGDAAGSDGATQTRRRPALETPLHRAIAALIDRGQPRGNQSVLLPDIGDESMVAALFSRLRRIVALTENHARLHALQSRYGAETLRVTIRLESLAQHAERRSGRYDLVLAAMNAEADVGAGDVNTYLENARRCLRPGGHAHVMLLLPAESQALNAAQTMVPAETVDIDAGAGMRAILFTVDQPPAPTQAPPGPDPVPGG